jgi:hypothetical protein
LNHRVMFGIVPLELLIFKPKMMTEDSSNEIAVCNGLTSVDKYSFQQHLAIWIGSSVKLALRLADVIQ